MPFDVLKKLVLSLHPAISGPETPVLACVSVGPVLPVAPPGVNASISAQANNDCFNICNGSATVLGSGGTPPFVYNWYDALGQSSTSVSNLCNGTYHAEITDGTGCKDTASVVITSPTELINSPIA